MDYESVKIIVLGVVTLGLAGISVWMHNQGQGGSGWGFAAFICLLTFLVHF